MHSEIKIPHRFWYFLLCYLAFSSYTVNFMMLELLRPKLMILYHLDATQIAPFYQTVFLGMLGGGVLYSIMVNLINYRTCFISIWCIQILSMVKILALSPIIADTSAIHQLKAGMLLLGVANGGIFSVIHPLLALIFQNPNQSKTHIMNLLHTNWPLFIILSYLFERLITQYQLDWFLEIYGMLFFSCLYMVIAVFLPLPAQTLSHRTPLSTRFKSVIRPGYILLLFCMIFSCIIEYSSSTWIHERVADLKIHPLYFLIFANGLQIIFRLFAGVIARKITPPGLLGLVSVLSAISLYLLSISTQTFFTLLAVGLFMMSIACYWPTYVAIAADRYPLSGGLGMGLMNVAAFFTLMHWVPEFSKLTEVETYAQAFLNMAWLAVFEFILLIGVYVAFKAQGGYKNLSPYERYL